MAEWDSDLDDYSDVGTSASPFDAGASSTCAFVYKHSATAGSLTVGCAIAIPRRRTSENDKRTYTLTLYQFEDAEFANLESILVRAAPSVCHHPDLGTDDGAEDKTKRQTNALEKSLKHKLISTLDVLSIESKPHKVKSNVDVNELISDLQALTGEEELTPHALKFNSPEWRLALQAASLLGRKEGYLQQPELRETFAVEFSALSAYMRLDSAAVTALNLLPSKEDKNKDFSLLGVLDKTVTKRLGTRLLTKWIRHPLVDVDEIEKRQNRVATLVADAESREALRSVLKSVPDLDQISKRFAQGKGGLEDLYLLYRFAGVIPQLAQCVSNLAKLAKYNFPDASEVAFQEEYEKISDLEDSGKFGQYKEFVEDVLDLNLAPREFLIRAKHDATGELERLAEERKEIDDEMDAIVRKLLNRELEGLDAKFEQDPRMIKTHGHHFRVPKKYDSQLGAIKNGRTILVVQACIRWTTSSIESLSERRAEIVARQNQVQSRLVKEAMQVAASYLPLIEMSAAIVAELDVLASFAHVAATCPQGDYTRPRMSQAGSGDIYFPNARHPCLELQPTVNFVPNTHEMKRDESRFQILTGPNMGGKSTYARQLGVLCVMAQIGSFVPCQEGAYAPVMDAILARVGASDAQLRGISTFMAEMIEASNIVKSCTNNSLIIIDELGRGTSTYDGFGLAWAISEHPATQTHAFVIFATHFHELTELAKSVKGVCNMHVAAVVQPDGGVVMLHEVRKGQCDESFGVNIAKAAGFPKEVVEDATSILKQLDKFKGYEMLVNDATNDVDLASPEAIAEDESVRKKLKQIIDITSDASLPEGALFEKVEQALRA